MLNQAFNQLADWANIIPWPLVVMVVVFLILVQVVGDVLSAIGATLIVGFLLALAYMYFTGTSPENLYFNIIEIMK